MWGICYLSQAKVISTDSGILLYFLHICKVLASSDHSELEKQINYYFLSFKILFTSSNFCKHITHSADSQPKSDGILEILYGSESCSLLPPLRIIWYWLILFSMHSRIIIFEEMSFPNLSSCIGVNSGELIESSLLAQPLKHSQNEIIYHVTFTLN